MRWRTVTWVVGILIVGALAVPLVLTVLLGSDHSRMPISVDDYDDGTGVVVEPGDEFEIYLLGHPAHPEASWAITDLDPAVVETLRTMHGNHAGTPDARQLAALPEPMRGIWTTLPDRPPEIINEEYGEEWRWPMTIFAFSGAVLGESAITLELRVDGELVHSFGITVSVVDDACEHFVGPDTFQPGPDPSPKVPNRCG
jgi:hypothetical protein